jgi:hypothetical protein
MLVPPPVRVFPLEGGGRSRGFRSGRLGLGRFRSGRFRSGRFRSGSWTIITWSAIALVSELSPPDRTDATERGTIYPLTDNRGFVQLFCSIYEFVRIGSYDSV